MNKLYEHLTNVNSISAPTCANIQGRLIQWAWAPELRGGGGSPQQPMSAFYCNVINTMVQIPQWDNSITVGLDIINSDSIVNTFQTTEGE